MKIITDKTIKIDIRDLKDKGFTYGKDIDGMLYDVVYFTTQKDDMMIAYQHRKESIHQKITIHWKNCNYGGNRAYFVCPYCNRKVLTVYYYEKAFKCRTCCNLFYKSQTENKMERMLNKSRKLREKLNSSSTFSGVIWGKPKGMHHKTFYRLTELNSGMMRQYKDTIDETLRGDV